MQSNDFCVYEHWRPDTGACFYVGKGLIKRVRSTIRRENERHCRIREKLKKLGLSVEVRVVASGLSEWESFELERLRIFEYRNLGVDLANMTEGGEGASGSKHSEETKARISKALSGIPKPHLIGKKHSAEHKSKISAAMVGHKVSEETRLRISAAQKGKTRPELIGRPVSAETRRKISESKLKRVAV